jgi:hypothetical protein
MTQSQEKSKSVIQCLFSLKIYKSYITGAKSDEISAMKGLNGTI